MNLCPCGSTRSFDMCCEPYLSYKKVAETPEILMRSRYTAYSLSKIDYIQKTMCGKAAKNYDPISAYQWASNAVWLGLEVKHVSTIKNDMGTVTFIASFLEKNQKQCISEKSYFKKIKGVWFYIDGKTK